jgi:hypothetical protein
MLLGRSFDSPGLDDRATKSPAGGGKARRGPPENESRP